MVGIAVQSVKDRIKILLMILFHLQSFKYFSESAKEIMAESLVNDNSTCVVCFKNVVYFSIGECDHPVCFECSTRMRVLCLQNECPICRQVLSRVCFHFSYLFSIYLIAEKLFFLVKKNTLFFFSWDIK